MHSKANFASARCQEVMAQAATKSSGNHASEHPFTCGKFCCVCIYIAIAKALSVRRIGLA